MARGADLLEGLKSSLLSIESVKIIDRSHVLDTRGRRVEDMEGAHRCGTHLTNDLLLEVECSADGCNGIDVEIPATLSRGVLHHNKPLQL